MVAKKKKAAPPKKSAKKVEAKKSSKPATKEKKADKKEGKKKRVRINSDVGIISYPYLAEPDSGREHSDGKYKVDLFINKDVWKKSEQAKLLKTEVLKLGKKHFDAENLSEFKHPFKNASSLKNCPEGLENCIMIRAKSDYQPSVIGPTRNEDGDFEKGDADKISEIMGGDIGRIRVTPFYYPQQGGGISLALNLVQFQQEGEALGSGAKAEIEAMDGLEVTVDDIEDGDDDDSEDDDSQEESEDEEEEDDSEEDDSDEESEEEDEEEDSEDSEDEEVDEDEEEKPSKKSGKGSKSGKSSKGAKAKKSSKDDEDFDFD